MHGLTNKIKASMKLLKPLILCRFTAIMCRIQLKNQFSSLKAGIKGKVESQWETSVWAGAMSRRGFQGQCPKRHDAARFPLPPLALWVILQPPWGQGTGTGCSTECGRKEVGSVSSSHPPTPHPGLYDGQCALVFGLDQFRAVGWTMAELQALPLIQTQWWKDDGFGQQLGGHCPAVWFSLPVSKRHSSLRFQLNSSPASCPP